MATITPAYLAGPVMPSAVCSSGRGRGVSSDFASTCHRELPNTSAIVAPVHQVDYTRNGVSRAADLDAVPRG